jgi:hypothetical protein
MPGRGPTTFQKRQKEQARKEKREEKLARRHQKKKAEGNGTEITDAELEGLGVQPSDDADGVAPQGHDSLPNEQ